MLVHAPGVGATGPLQTQAWMAKANTATHRLAKGPSPATTTWCEIPQYPSYIKWGLTGSGFIRIDAKRTEDSKHFPNMLGLLKEKPANPSR